MLLCIYIYLSKYLIKEMKVPDKMDVLSGEGLKAHILPDDSIKYITGFVDEFEISDKVGVRIEKLEG